MIISLEKYRTSDMKKLILRYFVSTLGRINTDQDIDKSSYNFNIEKIRDRIGVPYRRNSGDLDTNHNVVFIYPAEFNPHPGISYRPIKNQYYAADWTKNIILTDRMGSTKLVIGHDFEEGFRYLPFGKQIPMGDDDQRTAYIGKELDRESELGDHGVRKVDYGLGRFTTIDPLWEKYYAWSPYQYSMNNPVSLADWNGKDFGFVVHPDQAAGMGHTTLYYQNGQGDWFRFDMGNYNDQPSSGAWTTLLFIVQQTESIM